MKTVRSQQEGAYSVRFVDRGMAEAIAAEIEADAFVVTTPTVYELYARDLAQELGLSCLVLELSEADKSMAQVERVCQEAVRLRLSRRGLMIAVGGGLCLDVVTCAAAWYRRGVGYLPVPTTLVGQIDAGIGVKGAVNIGGKKSALGCYHLPRSVLIHTPWLRSLDRELLAEGLSEIVKMGIIRDARLFELVERDAEQLLDSALACPSGREVMERAIRSMLEELEPNLFETSYERLVDFGHSFSPVLESKLDFELHHGFAVAVDMALCGVLAAHHGLLPRAELQRMLSVLRRLELPTWHPALDEALIEQAVADCVMHRGGAANIVLPTAMGGARVCAEPGLFEGAYALGRAALA